MQFKTKTTITEKANREDPFQRYSKDVVPVDKTRNSTTTISDKSGFFFRPKYVDGIIVVANRNRGIYHESQTYHKHDLVLFNHHKYVCTVPESTGVIPSVTPSWRDNWELASLKFYIAQGIGYDEIGSVFQLQAHE